VYVCLPRRLTGNVLMVMVMVMVMMDTEFVQQTLR
jgi:hypothetical protein